MVNSSDILKTSILIVDDQAANVSLLEKMLRGAGYVSIASTRNPHEVCELHRKHRYSLILLDLQMPGLDGFQVMEGLKAIETDGYLPVLVITAQPDHKLRALKAGARDFVSKPFDLAEVLMRVHNMLEVRLLHLEAKARAAQAETQSEQAIRASELRYRRLFETAQDGILILDADTGQVVDANPFMKDLLGYSQEEFLGRKLWEIGPFKGVAASKIAFAELQHADRIR
jgi:DNA-binding response OmpR family regulator